MKHIVKVENIGYEIIKDYRNAFNEDENKKSKKINKISGLDEYLNNKCAYGCKYFVAKKIILWYNFLKIIAKEVQYER